MTHVAKGQKWLPIGPDTSTRCTAEIVHVNDDYVWYKFTDQDHFVRPISEFVKTFAWDHGVKVGQKYKGNYTGRMAVVDEVKDGEVTYTYQDATKPTWTENLTAFKSGFTFASDPEPDHGIKVGQRYKGRITGETIRIHSVEADEITVHYEIGIHKFTLTPEQITGCFILLPDHGIEVGQRYRGNGTERFVTVTGVLTDDTIMAKYDGQPTHFTLPTFMFKSSFRPVTRRPRTLDDVKKMLAKVESPTLWVKYSNGGWFASQRDINDTGLELWNKQEALMSINPFVDSPVILGPEVEE